MAAVSGPPNKQNPYSSSYACSSQTFFLIFSHVHTIMALLSNY
jgi:hypothetical protein